MTDKKALSLKALKSPKVIAALVVAVLSALTGGAYMTDGFRVEFSTCNTPEETPEEAPETPKEAPETPADPSTRAEPSNALEAPPSPEEDMP